ncbi:hypothetical protein SAMN05421780_101320 [Flexibacter flexilis DSM 6793]|uniref:Lipocalin-like domain-containing protein n=1 Tax=Flexibacter flexilis DSM 6793 TaxID=927664 RepID=A0A1I1DM44_9BACT|nr:hypothetical protein [Flexibacter flexilis]SFB75961.1 hypothetical protein SAMN05421780_101320 [Flexibacter flexilis DSM 6793]
MKNLFLVVLLLASLSLTAGRCGGGGKDQQNMQYLFTTWKHSYEEDKDGLTVFRDETFSFPPSRGRRGFTISSDGTFIDRPIAAADGNEARKGRWRYKDGELEMLLDDGQSYKVEVVEMEKGLLKIKKK